MTGKGCKGKSRARHAVPLRGKRQKSRQDAGVTRPAPAAAARGWFLLLLLVLKLEVKILLVQI